MGDCYHWNNVNKPFSEFVKSDKCIAGILIEVSLHNGKLSQYLVGDILNNGNFLGDEKTMISDTLVKRYRTVWSR
jgi:hypothetical protein